MLGYGGESILRAGWSLVPKRRFVGSVPGLIGKPWNEVSKPLYEFLRKLWGSEAGGIPPGATEDTPTDIEAGDTGDVGDPESGWAAGDHTHGVSTSTASALEPDSTSTEGSGTALARADHTHDMSKVMADVMSKISLGF